MNIVGLKDFLIHNLPFPYEGDEMTCTTTLLYQYNTLLNSSSSKEEIENKLAIIIKDLSFTMNKTMSYSSLQVSVIPIAEFLKIIIHMGITDNDVVRVYKKLIMPPYENKEAEKYLYEYIRNCVEVMYLGDIPIRNGTNHQQVTKLRKKDSSSVYIHWIRDITSWIRRSTPESGYSLLTIFIEDKEDRLLITISFQT